MRKWGERIGYFVAIVYGLLAAVPMSFWYDTGEIYIADVKYGDSITLIYSGGAKREFRGSYSVIGRRLNTNGIVCDASSGPFSYLPGSERPDPLTMEWWAPSDKRCHEFDPGVYAIETCWKAYSPMGWIFPNKTACVTSNPFRVTT